MADKVRLQIRVNGQVVEQNVDELLSVDGKPFVSQDDYRAELDESYRVLNVHEAQIQSLQQQVSAVISGLAHSSAFPNAELDA